MLSDKAKIFPYSGMFRLWCSIRMPTVTAKNSRGLLLDRLKEERSNRHALPEDQEKPPIPDGQESVNIRLVGFRREIRFRLIPDEAFCRNSCQRESWSMQCLLRWQVLLSCLVLYIFLRRAPRKNRAIGMKKDACDNFPTILSSSLRKHFRKDCSFEISCCHARNLLLGNAIVRALVLNSQPNTSLTSDGPPSAASLSASSIGTLLMGSFGATGRQTECIARGGPKGARRQFSSVSMKVRMMSSMKTSEKPSGCGGGRTIVGRAGLIG